jgi:hypothetical protein
MLSSRMKKNDKMKNLFNIKILSKLIEGNILILMNGIYAKSTTNILCVPEILKILIIILLLYWGYIVTFTNVLTIYLS